MQLKEYLFKKEVSISQFADELDYCRAYMSEIVNKRKPVGKKLANLIVKVTNGHVTYDDLKAAKEKYDL